MIALLGTLRERLEPTCDVEGCDRDPELLYLNGRFAYYCFEHHIEYLREIEGVEGSS